MDVKTISVVRRIRKQETQGLVFLFGVWVSEACRRAFELDFGFGGTERELHLCSGQDGSWAVGRPWATTRAPSLLWRWIAELLRPLLERHLNFAGGQAPCFVGADQFIYYRQHDPLRRFAPDIYVLPGVAPDTRVRSWKTWVDGSAPTFALEVVTSDWKKDYEGVPAVCDEAGVQELIIFDPSFSERPGGEGARFQSYRRNPSGALELAERHDQDRTWSESLQLWLRTAGFVDRTRLRLATGAAAETFVPTAEEAERAEKEAALARVGELEARLAEIDPQL